MRLLLDTHIFMWASDRPEKLARLTLAAIQDPGNDIFLSAFTAWEIAIKCGSGKLEFPIEEWDDMVRELHAELVPVTATQGLVAGALPRLHGDPFDRMLIAQARLNDLILVTDDRLIIQYGVSALGAAD